MLSMEMNQNFGAAAAPIEAKKNEFNPYQDNGGYVTFYSVFYSTELHSQWLGKISPSPSPMIEYPRDIPSAPGRAAR
jgi:hypothetical protein